MKWLILLLEFLDHIRQLFCQHEWIYDRRPDGELGLRCMKCLKQSENSLSKLIAWQPEYPKSSAARETDLPPALSNARPAAHPH